VESTTEPEICALATAWPQRGAALAASIQPTKALPAILVTGIDLPFEFNHEYTEPNGGVKDFWEVERPSL
jgi:hypothetical protein